MLALGMIPVVQTSSLDPLYAELPVLILKKWRDICSLNMSKVADELRPRWANVNAALTLQHWVPDYVSRPH